MYEVVNGITVEDNYFAEGELIDNNKGHFIADDPSTEKNEAWIEKEEE